MSYIKGVVVCRFCKKPVKYFWRLPDVKVDVEPDRKEYVFAEHEQTKDGYTVRVKCSECQLSTNVCYDHDVKLIEE